MILFNLFGLFALYVALDFISAHDNVPDYTSLVVNLPDIVPSVQRFESDEIQDYQNLLFNPERQELIIGARNSLIRLHVHTFGLIEKVKWPPTKRKVDLCRMKGQLEEDCHNYVTLLVHYKGKLLTCGTGAYSPICSWRKLFEMDFAYQPDFSGLGYAPYSPRDNATYLMTSQGQLYTGVMTDFSGHDPAILRILPPDQIIRTAKHDSRWLMDPDFVGSLEVGNFVYFFFREAATEMSACSEMVYSRVARVCKNDVGGDVILKDSWTTFAKARINCSLPGAYPFAFNHLQSIHYIQSSQQFATVFTTQQSGLRGSAVCLYSLVDLNQVFSGTDWQPRSYFETPKDSNFNCEVHGPRSSRPGQTIRSLIDAQDRQLVSSVLSPITLQPVHHVALETYRHIVAEVVTVKHSGPALIMFVFTSDAIMKKFVQLPRHSEACLVEVLDLKTMLKSPTINHVQILPSLGHVVIAGQRQVLKLAVHRCERFKTRELCIGSQDPSCGWSSRKESCLGPPDDPSELYYWHQLIEGCPRTDAPMDGGWGEWSSWFSCPQASNDGNDCQCRTRDCDSPKPSNGGKACQGPAITVSNCTIHGGWTPWADWSGCSATCGVAVRTRKRYCGNPAPFHGGRLCLGPDIQQEYCSNNACPVLPVAPAMGSWTAWAPWTRCSAPCGGGVRKRTRQCLGGFCHGCHSDYEVCNAEDCQEVERWSSWTPWLMRNVSYSNAVLLERFRLGCSGRVAAHRDLKISPLRRQKKVCEARDLDYCLGTQPLHSTGTSEEKTGWDTWSAWSVCSGTRNSTQERRRTCLSSREECHGHGKELRYCSQLSCSGTWSCWSEAGACSVTCGRGVLHRARECLVGHCDGDRVQTLPCNQAPCIDSDGFGVWSDWSACSNYQLRVRLRPCLNTHFCHGTPDAQMKKCHHPNGEPMFEASREVVDGKISLSIGMLGACVFGILLGTVAIIVALKHQRLPLICLPHTSRGSGKVPSFINNHPPPPPNPAKSNIYTPPPLRNIHPVSVPPNITLNPLSPVEGDPKGDKDFCDGLTEQETTLTLKRNMRTSLQQKDYI